MKLNHECVRKTLLYIEEHHQLGSFLRLDDFLHSKELSEFDEQDIKYTLLKLYEAKYIQGSEPRYGSNELAEFNCSGLTWGGHQFLDNIRDDGVWKKTKGIISKFSSVSVTLISNIAAGVITQLINKQMGI